MNGSPFKAGDRVVVVEPWDPYLRLGEVLTIAASAGQWVYLEEKAQNMDGGWLYTHFELAPDVSPARSYGRTIQFDTDDRHELIDN